ncbi:MULTISPECIES: hypothetical protein [Halomonadaceae]|jgi:hypothetical protein|uniref:Uncharacterized protein n=2 Tax=root TaxID=1 RepID=A0A7Z0NB23_9GAMM|nr:MULTISPECIES: hypothetical protein [Halomonas]QGQ69918.1 hypothetical protein FDY98_07245 [Halomonas sp. PA16-9]NVE92454.1 hypothetical protein [Halomonas titanicae]NYT74561.1 hypothetical protein [Halomonas sedimenti]PKH63360.1 hypothetical protein CXF94_00795 [Halomonas sp. Choline-3u-9]TMU18051.1 hypothetical protein E0L35_19970 [Halomonas sp. ATBC28]|tara:strand:+ start:2079 stop:2354 length:276 start_codon:yes stop_codon:yes gene_type:complete
MKISDMKQNIREADLSPEDEMKSYILSLAADLRLDTGHVLPIRVLLHRTLSFNPKQREALQPALNTLISEGYFEEKDDKAFLTEKGRDAIY